MNTSAIVTFGILAAFIWGGLIFIVSTAFRREGAKLRDAAARSHLARSRES